MEKLNFVKIQREQHVLVLTLARPEKRNAFTPTMVSEIAYALRLANEDPTVRLIQIEAEVRYFVQGWILKLLRIPVLIT